MGINSNNLYSIAGNSGYAPVTFYQIMSAKYVLLPKGFRNPFDKSSPALMTSLVVPPIWKPEYAGVIFYVPIDIQGKRAKTYIIYGADKRGLVDLVLTPYKEER